MSNYLKNQVFQIDKPSFSNYWTLRVEKLGFSVEKPSFDECEVDSTKSISRFRFIEITTEDIYKQLSRMPAGKATGLDDVSPRLLKAAACRISQPLTHIMNLGLRLGIVRWKHSRVTPFF